MINGIDLLYIVGALILLLILWEAVESYHNWSSWDRDRRHSRKRKRIELQDAISESLYRHRLRVVLRLGLFSANMNALTSVIGEATKAFNGFHEKLTNFNKIFAEDSQEKPTI